MVEKPSAEDVSSRMAVLGRYIITSGIFDISAKTKPEKDGEIQLTDALKVLDIQENMTAYAFQGMWYDVGSKLGFLKANVEFALRRKDIFDESCKYLKELVTSKLYNK